MERRTEYLSLLSLSAHFKTQLYAFLRDQALLALHQKSSTTSPASSPTSTSTSTSTTAATPTAPNTTPDPPPPPAALFTFTGRFSTVSTVSSTPHNPTILRHISHVRTELERASHLQLHPQNLTEPLVAFNQGFAVRFGCVHSLPFDLFIPKEVRWGGSPIRKDIKGELDVIVLVSHPLLPGQMTVVRFRMGML